MAVLTEGQKTELRNLMAKVESPQTWTKAQLGAALQAVEDLMQLNATKTSISNAIEGAAAGVFTAAQKNKIFAIWAVTFAVRQGIL